MTKRLLTACLLLGCLNIASGQSRIINTIAGVPGTDAFNGDGPALTTEFNFPEGICLDASGALYIADRQNNRVRKMTASGITTVAGSGGYGYTGDEGQATDATLEFPEAVSVDAAGNIYIADANNNVVRKVDAAGVIHTIAGNGTMGYNGDGIAATAASLSTPFSVCTDAAGDVYIADFGNSRIRKVTPEGVISTVAGDSVYGYNGDGGMATKAELKFPSAVLLDAAGDLIIADYGNSRIRKITPAGIISTIAGTGSAGYTGDGGPATAATLNAPVALALDTRGNLYIADDGNNNVRMINTADTITLVAGTGVYDFTGDGGPATAATLRLPEGVAADPFGRVYITDGQTFTIREVYDPLTLSTPHTPVVDGAMNIFPNPSSGQVTVQIPAALPGGTLTIYDATGQLVKSVRLSGSATRVDISGLADGVYFATYNMAAIRYQGTFTKVQK